MKLDSENTADYQVAAPEKVSISAARSHFSELLQAIGEEPDKVYEVDKFDTPLALLVSFEKYNPILQAIQQGNLAPILANLILNKWLGTKDVPAHISKPQLEELESMEQSQLLTLFYETPCDSIALIENKEALDQDLITRLIKRRNIANAILEAEKEGLYEVSEHLSGSR